MSTVGTENNINVTTNACVEIVTDFQKQLLIP